MLIYKTYEDASTNLGELCDKVIANRDEVIIVREESENVALLAADELNSLKETIHLLASPNNASRLFTALERAKTRTIEPQTIESLCQQLEFEEIEIENE